MAILADNQFTAEDPYNKTDKGQKIWVFAHDSGAVRIQIGTQVQTTIALTHESALKLAEHILAIVPAPVEAEVAIIDLEKLKAEYEAALGALRDAGKTC